MKNNFREDMQIVKKVNIDKLAKLSGAIKKLEKCTCKGEISITDNQNNVIAQTHYERFIMAFSQDIICIQKCNSDELMGSLEYTNVDAQYISDYEITNQSIKLTGQINDNLRIHILAVYQV